ncbi:MAG: 3-deoxy-manno-octulosonate cytidylyltransferase [Candidatus Polarisedimenticolaceae bacterium]|nr:3-deoxy-manno-octulosonate cytidylyltransferase [Candidatus Polarisedimenticolaceae bacterium]
MSFKVVIPARYASMRLPGKPLLDLAGKPMIQHVYERALASGADQVIVATDDTRIKRAVEAFGGVACITSSDHLSGSDRIAEVVRVSGWADDTIVVNLQGDEPCMPAELIDQVAIDMANYETAMVTTLFAPIDDRKMLFDPHVVKVVCDAAGYALYFSRAPMPWHRDEFASQSLTLPEDTAFSRHIGLYAYRADALAQFVAWPPAPIEMAESLEQLRILWQGGKIHLTEAKVVPGHGVDTADDLARCSRVLAG